MSAFGEEFWSSRYRAGLTGWDAGSITTPLKDYFDQLMEPFENTFRQLASVSTPEQLRSEPFRVACIGLFRDLRGVVASTFNKVSFQLFFEWLQTSGWLSLIPRLVDCWWDSPVVIIPLLRFVSELASNRTQRITFAPSSPNGFILFRESCHVLTSYGLKMLAALEASPLVVGDDAYKHRYKVFALCMEVLHRSLSGEYVNFGVFPLYNDNTLRDTIGTVIKLVMHIPQQDLLVCLLHLSTSAFLNSHLIAFLCKDAQEDCFNVLSAD